MTMVDVNVLRHTPLTEEYLDLLLAGNPGISISDRSMLQALRARELSLDETTCPSGLPESPWWAEVLARDSSLAQWNDILQTPGVVLRGIGVALRLRLAAIVAAGRF